MLTINSAPALRCARERLSLLHPPLLPVLIQGGCFGFQTLITDSPVVFMLSTGGAQQILNQQILNGSGRHRGGAHTRPDKDGNTQVVLRRYWRSFLQKNTFLIYLYTQVRAGDSVALGGIQVESIRQGCQVLGASPSLPRVMKDGVTPCTS